MAKWIRSDSEAITGFRYNETTSVLRVRLSNGAIYDYLRTPQKLYDQLAASSTNGAFFTAHIREKLAFKRIK